MEPHGACCRGCRGVSIQGHLQLVLDHAGGGQGVRADTDDVNIAPLPQQPQSLKYPAVSSFLCGENSDGTR